MDYNISDEDLLQVPYTSAAQPYAQGGGSLLDLQGVISSGSEYCSLAVIHMSNSHELSERSS
jgi:hypothetical protein